MGKLTTAFFRDAYIQHPELNAKDLYRIARGEGPINPTEFTKQTLELQYGKPSMEKFVAQAVGQANSRLWETAGLVLSRFTCGVAEIGGLYQRGLVFSKKRILGVVLLAIMYRKGKISFYMPVSGDVSLQELLQVYGFSALGAPFYNPNSAAIVQEWVAYNEGKAGDYVSK